MMECDYMSANLVVGDGTALRSENAQNVERTTLKEPNEIHECINMMFSCDYLSET
jgi:hypothetical protein